MEHYNNSLTKPNVSLNYDLVVFIIHLVHNFNDSQISTKLLGTNILSNKLFNIGCSVESPTTGYK